MFERIKKVFSTPEKPKAAEAAPLASTIAVPPSALSIWAAENGYAFTGIGEGKAFHITGKTMDKPWKLELGRSSRDYIHGDELRARAELNASDNAAILIMNRPLKEALEKKAYQMYTDTLQTTADPSLPEEMRWLAMYPEEGWETLSQDFWSRYAVLAEQRDYAQAWLHPGLARLLMTWPQPGPNDQVPFILMLLRGKAYLRMQYTPADLPTLAHASRIFNDACESALTRLADITI